MSSFEIPIRIYDLNKSSYQIVPAILDTGATKSLIPPQRLLDLGYDLANAPRRISKTANGPTVVLSVDVTKMTAIQQSTERIEVICFEPDADIPEPLGITGLLGMNFLSRFDNLNISFSTGTVTLT